MGVLHYSFCKGRERTEGERVDTNNNFVSLFFHHCKELIPDVITRLLEFLVELLSPLFRLFCIRLRVHLLRTSLDGIEERKGKSGIEKEKISNNEKKIYLLCHKTGTNVFY